MKHAFDIHANKKYWFAFSGTLVTLSVVLFLTWGLNLGLDFTGGTLMRVDFDKTLDKSQITEFVTPIYPEAQVSAIQGTNEWNIKTRTLTQEEDDLFIKKLEGKFGKVSQTGIISIGSVVSDSLKQKAFLALGLALLGMILTIAWEFRKLPTFLSSWKFGVVAVIALFHDIMITVGVFVILGKFFDVSVDTFFVTALLTILGYSISDTIVIFDKIRENSFKMKKSFEEIAEDSVWETMRRSLSTTMTMLLAEVSLLVFGPEQLRVFVTALLIGTVFGSYSSIFIASPLLVTWHKEINPNNK